jgi:hypothetical protein
MDYYRLAPDLPGFEEPTSGSMSEDIGFFQFGANNVCFGRCRTGVARTVDFSGRFNASRNINQNGSTIALPFDFTEVVENLRLERYRQKISGQAGNSFFRDGLRELYYPLRKYLPDSFRRRLQRAYLGNWRRLKFPAWPVDCTVDALHAEHLRLLMEINGAKKIPFIWFWPEGASACLIMTHDVETSAGRDFTSQLMDLDEKYGFKASFQVVPEERYELRDAYVDEIRSRGFEFNIHDLNHDGRLYSQHQEFVRRAAKINSYVRRYAAKGFRAGAMYRNQDWYEAFDFSYDMSVPNVAHLEAVRGGCCTVMPYFVGKIVELPLTTAEDYSLFHILNDYSTDLWKQQLSLIGERNGLMSFIAHPDYLIEPRARSVYESLLDYLRQCAARENLWSTLPGEADRWWRARSQMTLVSQGDRWVIVGQGSERARLAYALLEGARLRYEIPQVA